ncbi:glycosyltransferase [Brevundimonas balnearis]|uniref:Glycosyltransferase n=1 Tax=Brevundimonas balnearis TaxID=1572858 RepID=A0ABV6QYH7_9CAUL
MGDQVASAIDRPHARTGAWALIQQPTGDGWILDRIVNEVAKVLGPRAFRWADLAKSPPAETIFFPHYSLYMTARDHRGADVAGRSVIWFTHPGDYPYSTAELLLAFGAAKSVLFPCSRFRDLWVAQGLDVRKTRVILGAADPALFRGRPRAGRVVGVNAAYYPRKGSRLLLETVRAARDLRFELLGRGWRASPDFDDLSRLANFTYLETPYSKYPSRMRRWHAFLSTSRLEGGPVPLVEAMMANATPVATDTGFAPDLITHGRTGFIIDPDDAPDQVADVLREAAREPIDSRSAVVDLSWTRFAREVVEVGDGAAAGDQGRQRGAPPAPPRRERPAPAAAIPAASFIAYSSGRGPGADLIWSFARGHGAQVAPITSPPPDDRRRTPVLWGLLDGALERIRAAKADGAQFVYLDHAYLGRGHGRRYRMCLDGFHAGPVREADAVRLADLNITPRPWRSGGSVVLVCPPTAAAAAANDTTPDAWLARTLALLRTHTDRPLEIRRKPRPGHPAEPLASALGRAHAVVCHTSTIAVEATIAGVPAFVDPASPAAPVAGTDLARIECPTRPDRGPWLRHLACMQFSVDEFEAGRAWSLLIEHLSRPEVKLAP